MPKKTRKPAKDSKPGVKAPQIRTSKSSGNISISLDMFRNMAARMGYGTPSLAEGTDYTMVRLSLNYWLMLTLYRNHWIARRIVDVPAEDMTREWCNLNSELDPGDIQRFGCTIDRTFTPSRIEQAIKWARLYGGAGALMVIEGHERYLNEPLDLEDIGPGAFKGLLVFDRWQGIIPDGQVSSDFSRPQDFGLPESYRVTAQEATQAYHVHASRILRFIGPDVPIPELQAMSWWGISVLELVFEELRKRDNASWSMLQLIFRAQILAQRNPDLATALSGLGISQQALQNFSARMSAQNELLSNQSMLILPEEGELFSTQYSFSGLGEIYAQFQMDVAGAAEMTVAKLFGRTITGLGQSNEADERHYESRIAHEQSSKLKPQIMKLYPVVCMSEFGEVPKDLDIDFPSIRVLTQEEKGDMADKGSAPNLAMFNAGVYGQKTALKEAKQLAETTGIFTNITDEMINKASDDVQLPGEMGGFGGEAQGEVGGPPAGHARSNPMRQLRQEAGGALDALDGILKNLSRQESGEATARAEDVAMNDADEPGR